MVSEYGGAWWATRETDVDNWDSGKAPVTAWGYGKAPVSQAEFFDRYEKLTGVLLGNPYSFGFCYTQLYDVEQEENGLYTYDRKRKFTDDIYEAIEKVNRTPAAFEEPQPAAKRWKSAGILENSKEVV